MQGKTLLSGVMVLLGLPAASSPAEVLPVFAKVDGTEITRQEFDLEVYNQARRTFYHGRPSSEAEYLEFRRGVAGRLVDRVLLLNEARRRGITADHDSVAARLAAYEERYAGTERWETDGPRMLASLRQRFEEDSVLDRLEREVTAVGSPDDSELRGFYEENPDKFTEPEQTRASVILLSVAPSSPPAAWDAARREGADIATRIRGGADFGELARVHSADPSGKNGGDMGYLHAGMLSDAAQAALDELAVGELSEPVTVLEGVAIFRLTERRPARLQAFEEVHARAMELWRRKEREEIWEKTVVSLRSRSNIMIDDAYLQSLPVQRE